MGLFTNFKKKLRFISFLDPGTALAGKLVKGIVARRTHRRALKRK